MIPLHTFLMHASVALNFTSEEPEMSRKLDPKGEFGELTFSMKPGNRRKELTSHCPKVTNLTDRGSSFHFLPLMLS